MDLDYPLNFTSTAYSCTAVILRDFLLFVQDKSFAKRFFKKYFKIVFLMVLDFKNKSITLTYFLHTKIMTVLPLWYFTNYATCPWLSLFCPWLSLVCPWLSLVCPWLSRACPCLFRVSSRMSLIHCV